MNKVNPANDTQLNELNDKIGTLDTNLRNLDTRFEFFGTNLTEQLQRQEERSLKSWVSELFYLSTGDKNCSSVS